MTDFLEFGLPTSLINALQRLKITAPTPIQQASIPPALAGQDLLASAQTGTGKTIAYLVPLLKKLSEPSQQCALILAPTRELAMQIAKMLHELLGRDSSMKTAVLIGGAPMGRQISDLKRRPQLIIGTPGRIMDHLDRGTLSLSKTKFLVIDEADRMLDMGFEIQLNKIAEYLPSERQTLMFSATLPPSIEKLSQKYLRSPQRIAIGSTTQAVVKIKQEVLHTRPPEKFSLLCEQLQGREGSIIVFVKTRHGTERLAKELQKLEHNADAIHGDLPQRRRERVIHEFRNSRTRILVATDVAARGLDVPHVMHVINFDLPQCPEDYIHRIGRTGRAGAEGHALCLVSPEDTHKWRAIQRFMNPGEKEARSEFPKSRGFRGPKRSFGPKRAFQETAEPGKKRFGRKKWINRH